MKTRVSVAAAAALSAFALGGATYALAAELPEIKISAHNPMPACATPGRLMAFIKSRNGEFDARFEQIAIEYMRSGEELGMRWDYALFQMIVETGALSFKNGNRQGDVRANQNNFAGLGAAGNGEAGESFKDVASGVKAHLQHLMLYAGQPVVDPVAERTRKVQEWGILASWQKGFKKPITFADLAAKWASKSKTYASNLEQVADGFYSDTCKKADPHPEMVAAARGETKPVKVAEKLAEPVKEKVSGTDLARKAIDDGKAQAVETKSGLGVGLFANSGAVGTTGGMRILNAPAAPVEPQAPVADAQSGKAKVQTAAAAGAAKPLAAPAAGMQKCRVWTASYGGQKAVIIKAVIDGVLNYTVLDVNEGQESREAEAFIAAYAKNGGVAGEFQNQNQALDKAFEFCPEG